MWVFLYFGRFCYVICCVMFAVSVKGSLKSNKIIWNAANDTDKGSLLAVSTCGSCWLEFAWFSTAEPVLPLSYEIKESEYTYNSRMSTTSERLSNTSFRRTMFGCFRACRMATSRSTLLRSRPRRLQAVFRIFKNLPAQQLPDVFSRTFRTWPKWPLE